MTTTVPTPLLETTVAACLMSALRSFLALVFQGLIGVGTGMGMCLPPDYIPGSHDCDQLPATPLSRAEHAAWTALVERLR
jgi:hypothetical protein